MGFTRPLREASCGPSGARVRPARTDRGGSPDHGGDRDLQPARVTSCAASIGFSFMFLPIVSTCERCAMRRVQDGAWSQGYAYFARLGDRGSDGRWSVWGEAPILGGQEPRGKLCSRRLRTLALLAALTALVARVPGAGASGGGHPTTPGTALMRSNPTPFRTSTRILGAVWTSPRYDPPPNQAGDILPTLWSDDGSSYVLMDDGGVDVPLAGGLWRQSLAHISGTPPHLRFHHVGDSSLPPPRTWGQIGGNRDND